MIKKSKIGNMINVIDEKINGHNNAFVSATKVSGDGAKNEISEGVIKKINIPNKPPNSVPISTGVVNFRCEKRSFLKNSKNPIMGNNMRINQALKSLKALKLFLNQAVLSCLNVS